MASQSEDGRQLFLILANGSWDRSVPCTVRADGFTPDRAEAVVLTHDDPDADALLERKEELVHTLPVTLNGPQLTLKLPPHAVAFVTLTRSANP